MQDVIYEKMIILVYLCYFMAIDGTTKGLPVSTNQKRWEFIIGN